MKRLTKKQRVDMLEFISCVNCDEIVDPLDISPLYLDWPIWGAGENMSGYMPDSPYCLFLTKRAALGYCRYLKRSAGGGDYVLDEIAKSPAALRAYGAPYSSQHAAEKARAWIEDQISTEDTMKPLSLAFNAAVMTIANRVNPLGWNISEDAPASLAELQDTIKNTGRITVDSRNSDHTIFADREHNYAFRAWHDWTHWIIRAEFTLDGELAVAHRQCEDLCRIYGHSARTRKWCAYVMAEVYGQACHQAETGHFPEDQVAFDLAWIGGGNVR